MKRKQTIWLQVLYWSFNFIGTVISPLFFFDNENQITDYVLRMTYFTVGICTFYFCYLFVIPRIFNPKKLYTTVLVFFLSILFFATLRYIIEEVILPSTLGLRNYNRNTGYAYYFFDNFYNGSITFFIAGIFSLLEKRNVIETERKQYELDRNEAKIQALKMQINPDFIFNKLNNIHSLVCQKSEKALPAIEELSQLLRESTKNLEKDFIFLERETDYTKDYT